MSSEREISESAVRSRLKEAILGSGYEEDIRDYIADLMRSGAASAEGLELEKSEFIKQYRAFHAQLREDDQLKIKPSLRRSAEFEGVYFDIILHTSKGIECLIASKRFPGQFRFDSPVLYDNFSHGLGTLKDKGKR